VKFHSWKKVHFWREKNAILWYIVYRGSYEVYQTAQIFGREADADQRPVGSADAHFVVAKGMRDRRAERDYLFSDHALLRLCLGREESLALAENSE
jgi:hypothetical protein